MIRYLKYLSILLLIPVNAKAETLQDFAKTQVSTMHGVFNDKNLEALPSFSQSEVQQKTSELANMDDAELKIKSMAVVDNAAENSPEKTLTKIGRRHPLDGIEKHSIFERSEQVWSNLKDSLEKWLGTGCKEVKQNKHNTLREKLL